MTFFAHAGHEHAIVTEQTQTSLGAGLPPDVWVGCAVIVGIGVLWLLASVVFKCNLAVKTLLITAGLLVVGVTTYQYAPIVSTVALAVGMVLSLLGVLAQLALPKRRQGTKE